MGEYFSNVKFSQQRSSNWILRIKSGNVFKHYLERILTPENIFRYGIQPLPKAHIAKPISHNIMINVILLSFSKIASCQYIFLNILGRYMGIVSNPTIEIKSDCIIYDVCKISVGNIFQLLCFSLFCAIYQSVKK